MNQVTVLSPWEKYITNLIKSFHFGEYETQSLLGSTLFSNLFEMMVAMKL